MNGKKECVNKEDTKKFYDTFRAKNTITETKKKILSLGECQGTMKVKEENVNLKTTQYG